MQKETSIEHRRGDRCTVKQLQRSAEDPSMWSAEYLTSVCIRRLPRLRKESSGSFSGNLAEGSQNLEAVHIHTNQMESLKIHEVLCRAAVPNLFSTRDQFHGKQFFHSLEGKDRRDGLLACHQIQLNCHLPLTDRVLICIGDPSEWRGPSSHSERPVESEVWHTGPTPMDRFSRGESGLHCT